MSRKIAGNNKFDFNKPFGGLPKEVWLNANRDCMRIAANRQDKIKKSKH
ncbi:MAG: hypothetical protein FWE49_02350 [Synergistaceae bacterium]|nr:hypothetical protein [Synergistaceae bacterium]